MEDMLKYPAPARRVLLFERRFKLKSSALEVRTKGSHTLRTPEAQSLKMGKRERGGGEYGRVLQWAAGQTH